MSLEFNRERLDTVQYTQKNEVGVIRFKTNILYFETLTRLQEIVDQLSNQCDIGALFFEVEGKNFLLGADVNYFHEAILLGRQDQIMIYSGLGNDLFDSIECLPCPTVACISGATLGGGFELALACSVRIAAPGSSFAFPEIGLGIFPGWGGIKRLQRKIEPALAKWIIYTGKSIPARLANELGFVDAITPDDTLNNLSLQFLEQQGITNTPRFSNRVPDKLRRIADLFELPLSDILGRTPGCQEEKIILDTLKRQAPVSLNYAERIFNQSAILEQPLERWFEDTLAWQIYYTPDAERGLNHVRSGKLGKPVFSGATSKTGSSRQFA